jgi:hypothetical protein
MALITRDAVSASSVGDATSTLTWSHTVGSGSNKILVVGVGARDPTAGNTVVNSVVFNTSESFTKVRDDSVGGVQTLRSGLWYLLNPSTTTANIVVTFAGAADDSGAGAISLFNVSQSSPIDAQNGSNAATQASPLSTSITVVGTNCWIIDAVYSKSDIDISAVSPQVAYYDLNPRAGGDSAAGSYIMMVPAGSNTMSWIYPGGSDDYAHSVISLTPATDDDKAINPLYIKTK